jgi:hypothetical protein
LWALFTSPSELSQGLNLGMKGLAVSSTMQDSLLGHILLPVVLIVLLTRRWYVASSVLSHNGFEGRTSGTEHDGCACRALPPCCMQV